MIPHIPTDFFSQIYCVGIKAREDKFSFSVRSRVLLTHFEESMLMEESTL